MSFKRELKYNSTQDYYWKPISLFKLSYSQLLRPWQTRTHCGSHIVADTNVSPFARARNICCGHKFCVWDTKMFLILFRNILCPHQMFPSLRSPRNIVGNNVSATMCPRLPGPKDLKWFQIDLFCFRPASNLKPFLMNGNCPRTRQTQQRYNLVFSVRTLSYGSSFFPYDLWPTRFAIGP